MTNLEASKIIEDGLDDLSLDYVDDEQYDALQVAVKVLKQEPCEDTISMSVVEDVKAEIRYYRDAFILGNRHDLAAVAENCLMFIDKHISGKESE